MQRIGRYQTLSDLAKSQEIEAEGDDSPLYCGYGIVVFYDEPPTVDTYEKFKDQTWYDFGDFIASVVEPAPVGYYYERPAYQEPSLLSVPTSVVNFPRYQTREPTLAAASICAISRAVWNSNNWRAGTKIIYKAFAVWRLRIEDQHIQVQGLW